MPENNMLLSVIIPVYKVEHTLDRCIKSVVTQGIDNIQIILVDDGSPDKCPALCDEWAATDHRIQVIHKRNGGLSSARNAGIDIATGEYITFVDSDDYLSSDTYLPLMRQLAEHPEIDMIEYSFNITGGKRLNTSYADATFNTADEYWMHTHAWSHSYACNKIYRRSLFNGLRYEEGKLYEDLFLMPHLLKKNPRIATSSLKGYNYCLSENSISCKTNRKNIKQLLIAEIKAARIMHTHPFSLNGLELYKAMIYRITDIIKSYF